MAVSRLHDQQQIQRDTLEQVVGAVAEIKQKGRTMEEHLEQQQSGLSASARNFDRFSQQVALDLQALSNHIDKVHMLLLFNM